jgi:hypothetical protein
MFHTFMFAMPIMQLIIFLHGNVSYWCKYFDLLYTHIAKR